MIALFSSKSKIAPVAYGEHPAPAPLVRTITVEQRRLAFKAAKRHSALVRILKWFLPVSVFTIIGFFILFLQGPGVMPENVSITSAAVESGKLVMIDPVMDGFTKDQKPYQVKAEKALQDVLAPDIIELQQMQANFPFSEGKSATLTAKAGLMDNAQNILTLSEGVELVTDDGMVVKLQNATINIGDGRMQTKEPVDIKREGMAITANQMDVENSGRNLVFQDRVRVTLAPDAVRRQEARSSPSLQ